MNEMPPCAAGPLVSVIIPTIGRPRYIGTALKSVLGQSYGNIEVLVSDNAPDIPTRDIAAAQGIADERIRYHSHATRLAFTDHMNFCLTAAKGMYYIIVSDDDVISSQYIAEAVAVMESNARVSVCLGRQVQTSAETDTYDADPGMQAGGRQLDGLEFLKSLRSGTLGTTILTFFSLFARRMDVVSRGGFRPYPDGSHADNYIMTLLCCGGSVALLESVLYYRIYSESFGLSTPFKNLLQATNMYTTDLFSIPMKTVVLENNDNTEEKNETGRLQTWNEILFLCVKGNIDMLLSRLEHFYRDRLSPEELHAFAVKINYYAQRWLSLLRSRLCMDSAQ